MASKRKLTTSNDLRMFDDASVCSSRVSNTSNRGRSRFYWFSLKESGLRVSVILAAMGILLFTAVKDDLTMMLSSVLFGKTLYISPHSRTMGSSKMTIRKNLLPEILRQHAAKAKQFVFQRKKAYEESGRAEQWKLRGVGYLLTQHKMILAGVVPESPALVGRNVISIYDVKMTQRDDCNLLMVWVRVSGPEIFSGSAQVVDDTETCHWEFPFYLQVSGEYEVDVKLLSWNGAAVESDPNNMTIENNKNVPFQKYPVHASIKGLNFNNASQSCCEACSRTPGCVYWSTPALHFPDGSSCEFYFNNTAAAKPFLYYSKEIRPSYVSQELRGKTTAHGPPHAKVSSYFMGCGWNFYLNGVSRCESPWDDSIYMKKQLFTLIDAATELEGNVRLPLCDLKKHEDKSGRWVRERYPDKSLCPEELDLDRGKRLSNRLTLYDFYKFQGDEPHCWFRENIHSLTTPCFTKEGCLLKRKKNREKPIGYSSLNQETKWFGTWKNYDCHYREFTNRQLQQCIDRRKIVNIEIRGTVLARYVQEYLQQRLSQVQLYRPNTTHNSDSNNNNNNDNNSTLSKLEPTLNVTLYTFPTVDLPFHQSQHEWEKELAWYPSVRRGEEKYYMEAMYSVSERYPLVTSARAREFNRVLGQVWLPKGYKRIAAYELSSAFSFDSAMDHDGMRIIGPPLRSIVTKFFHYLCRDHVEHDQLGGRHGPWYGSPGSIQ